MKLSKTRQFFQKALQTNGEKFVAWFDRYECAKCGHFYHKSGKLELVTEWPV